MSNEDISKMSDEDISKALEGCIDLSKHKEVIQKLVKEAPDFRKKLGRYLYLHNKEKEITQEDKLEKLHLKEFLLKAVENFAPKEQVA